MSLTLDLSKSIDTNLKDNKVLTAGRRRKRVGGNDTPATETTPKQEIEAAKPAADYGLTTTLKTAYDYLITQGLKVGTVVAEASAAGAIVYAVDTLYRKDLCDPLLMSGAKLLNALPIVGAYAMKCDNAAIAYHTAVSASILLVTPLLVEAFKSAGKLVVPAQTVEDVAENIVEAVKNPGAAATYALARRRGSIGGPAANLVAPPKPLTMALGKPIGKGGRRTKKGGKKKMRKTRRPRFFKY